jgi:hypothetical protein
MANKEAVFTLRVNTGSSVQDVQSFDAAVQNLNNDIQEVQQTASKTPGIDAFEAKLQELNARVEAGGLSMREMTQVMKEYQTIAAQAGVQSPIGAQALQNAASLKDEIGDIKAATTALSSDFVGLDTAVAGIETGTAVFQGFQSAIALTGVENEALMQTMVKLQAAQGLVNAVSTIANKLNKEAILGIQVRAALEKTMNFIRTGSIAGTKAQAAATTGLATAEGVATGATGFLAGAMKALRAAFIASGIGALIMGLMAAAEALGIFGDDSENFEKEQAAAFEAEMARNKSRIDALNLRGTKEQNMYQRTIDLMKAEGKDVTDIEIKKINASINFQKEKIKELRLQIASNKALLDEAEIMGNLGVGWEEYNRRLDANNSMVDELEATKEGLLDSENQLKIVNAESSKSQLDNSKKLAEDAQKKRKERADAEKKRREEEAKAEKARVLNLLKIEQEFRDQIMQAESAYQDSLLTAQQQETNIVLDKYFTLIQKAKEYKQDTTVLEAARTAELLAITDKYNKEAIAKQAEADQKKKELLEAYQDIVSDDLDQQVLDLERSQAEESKVLSEALASNVITNEEYLAAQLVLENEYTAKLKEVADERVKIQTDADKKSFDAKITAVERAIEIAQGALNSLSAINDLVNQTQENRIAEAQAQAEEQKSIYDKQQADELSNTALTEEQRKAITDKYNKLRYQAELKAFQEEDKLKKQQFDRDKAFKIAQIAIDTASAIVKSVSASPTTFGLPFSAFALTTGVAQAAAVASTQYKSGTPPSLAGGGSAGSLTGAGASSFTAANTNTEQTNLQDVLGQGGNNQGTISKVYVLESDITNTQQKVSVQEQLSTY